MNKLPTWFTRPEQYLFNAKFMGVVFGLSLFFMFMPLDMLPAKLRHILIMIDGILLFGSAAMLVLIGFSSGFDVVQKMMGKNKK